MNVKLLDGDASMDIEEDDETASFETCIGFEEVEELYVWLNGDYSGSIVGGSSGSYWDPPEPGDHFLDWIEVTAFVTTPEVDGEEITNDAIQKSDCGITMKMMDALSTETVQDHISYDTSKVNFTRVQSIPEKLAEKIERVREENKNTIKIKMAKKKFNL